MATAETASEIHRPQIKCSLTVDELDVLVDKIVNALPEVLENEWFDVLEDMPDSEPIAEQDEDRFAFAFWAAARIVIAGLVKYGLTAEPLIASIEVITGADRATIQACVDPERQVP